MRSSVENDAEKFWSKVSWRLPIMAPFATLAFYHEWVDESFFSEDLMLIRETGGFVEY
jgi:hypothetical protein